MQKGQETVTSLQVSVGLISIMLGVEFLAMPKNLAQAAGRDGWMSLILGGLLVALVVFFLTVLGRRFPGQSPVEYAQEILGKPLGIAVILFMLGIYSLEKAYMVREFADVVKLYLLSKTPTELIILSLLLVSAYAVNHGINAVLRVMQVFFPLLIIPLLFLCLMAVPLTDFNEILPFLENGVVPVFTGVISSFKSYAGFSVIVFFLPFLQEPQKATPACLLGVGIVVALYLIMFLLSLVAFGPVELAHILYPISDLVRMIEVPGTFIERFDIIILSLWILAAFNIVTGLYFAICYILSGLLGITSLSSITYLVLPLIYLLAMFPPDIVSLQKLGELIAMLSFSMLAVAPLILIVALIRGKGGKAQ